jgi:hypothetical protein
VSSTRARAWPTVVAALALALLLVADVASLAQHRAGYPHVVAPWLEGTTATLVYLTVGWFIARRVPGHRLGPLMLALSAVAATQLAIGVLAIESAHDGWPTLWQAWLGGVYNATTSATVSLLLLVVLLAPTGRPLNRFFAGVCWTVIVATAVWIVTSILLGTDDQALPGGPFDHSLAPEAARPAVWAVNLLIMLIIITASLLALVELAMRFRQSEGEDRRQVTWVVAGGLGGIGILWLSAFLSQWLPHAAWLGSVPWAIGPSLLPLGIAVAVLRHGLYQLDSVVSRTVSYAVVTGVVIVIYTLVVAAVSQLVPSSDSAAVAMATLAAAASARPVLRRVRERVDRQFNRTRFDHDQAVASFSRQLQNNVDPDVVRTSMLGMVHRSLEPRAMALWVKGET